jgi:hypothetical protein
MPVRVPIASSSGRAALGYQVTNMETKSMVSACVVPSTGLASPLQELQNEEEEASWELLFQTSIAPFSVQAFKVVAVAAAVRVGGWVWVWWCMYTYIHAYMHTYIHAYTHMHACMHAYIWMDVHIRTYIHT